MLLRWIVGNYLRQSAESAVQKTLRQAARVVQRVPEGPPEIPQHYRLAIVSGLGLELTGLVNLMGEPAAGRYDQVLERWGPLDDLPLRVVEVGVGAEHAAQSTRQLIARSRPNWVVAAGFATALDPSLRRGDLLMPDRILAPDGSALSVGFQIERQVLEATPYLRVGPLLSLDHVAATRAEKEELATSSHAIACDMESQAVAAVCHQEHVRFLAVRIITDERDDELPAELAHLLHQKTLAGKLGAAAGAVFRRPASVKDLWHLREDAQKASSRLALFLRGLLPQLEIPSQT
jgi:adenosylhomocysteine nucleosidase